MKLSVAAEGLRPAMHVLFLSARPGYTCAAILAARRPRQATSCEHRREAWYAAAVVTPCVLSLL